MKEINLETWNRKEHFKFFSQIVFPFYSISSTIDVTKFYAYVKERNISFYYGMIFLCAKVMNQIDAFRYRIREGKVYLIDEMIPSFTDLKAGSELFQITNVMLTDTMSTYSQACKKAVSSQKTYFPSPEDEMRDDFIYFSSVPWISFTSVTHEMDINKDDSIPRITFGKYEKTNIKISMPISLQCNHRLVDGLHVGQFIKALVAVIKDLE